MPHSKLIHLSDLHIGLRKKESDQTRSVIRKISSSYPAYRSSSRGILRIRPRRSSLKTRARL